MMENENIKRKKEKQQRNTIHKNYAFCMKKKGETFCKKKKGSDRKKKQTKKCFNLMVKML